MRKLALISSASMLAASYPVAFANSAPPAAGKSAPPAPAGAAPADAADAPKTDAPPAADAKPAKADKAPLVIGEVENDIPIPTNAPGRGRASKSPFDFDSLTSVGMSRHIANRTAKSLSSIISNQNRKATSYEIVKDAEGKPVMKQGEPIKDGNGGIVGYQPTTEPKRVRVKHFKAFDVDAKDPKGAGVRIFRIEPEQEKA